MRDNLSMCALECRVLKRHTSAVQCAECLRDRPLCFRSAERVVQ